MSVEKLDKDGFLKAINSSEPVIVDFYADWCMPCKMITPILEEIAAEKNVGVYKVNIDEFPELAKEYSIMSIPNVISFKDGVLYKRIVGAQPKNILLELLN